MSTESVSYALLEWEFCDRLRKVRRRIAHMSQGQMAEQLGVEQKAYAAWESGRTKPSDIVAVSKQIERLWPGRVTAGWLLGLETLPGGGGGGADQPSG